MEKELEGTAIVYTTRTATGTRVREGIPAKPAKVVRNTLNDVIIIAVYINE